MKVHRCLVAGSTAVFFAYEGFMVTSAQADTALVKRPMAVAAAEDPQRLSVADLEDAFWSCEAAVMRAWAEARDDGFCGGVYRRLLADRFNGDSEMMLAWWRDNGQEKLAGLGIELETAPALAASGPARP